MSEKEIASLRELIQANAISDLNHFEANERRIERIENNIDYARFEIQTQKIEVLKKKLLNIESVHDVFVDVMDKQTKFEKILWKLFKKFEDKHDEVIKRSFFTKLLEGFEIRND